jgi:hypothetical protein
MDFSRKTSEAINESTDSMKNPDPPSEYWNHKNERQLTSNSSKNELERARCINRDLVYTNASSRLTMLSRCLLRVARQATAQRSPSTALRVPTVASFSTQELVLGKGRAKTSTGLVSIVCMLLFTVYSFQYTVYCTATVAVTCHNHR